MCVPAGPSMNAPDSKNPSLDIQSHRNSTFQALCIWQTLSWVHSDGCFCSVERSLPEASCISDPSESPSWILEMPAWMAASFPSWTACLAWSMYWDATSAVCFAFSHASSHFFFNSFTASSNWANHLLFYVSGHCLQLVVMVCLDSECMSPTIIMDSMSLLFWLISSADWCARQTWFWTSSKLFCALT